MNQQKAVLNFLQDYVDENGTMPSYREIQAGLGLSSVSAVAEHIDNLVNKGVLKKVPGAARSLEILDYKHEDTVELFKSSCNLLKRIRSNCRRIRFLQCLLRM